MDCLSRRPWPGVPQPQELVGRAPSQTLSLPAAQPGSLREGSAAPGSDPANPGPKRRPCQGEEGRNGPSRWNTDKRSDRPRATCAWSHTQQHRSRQDSAQGSPQPAHGPGGSCSQRPRAGRASGSGSRATRLADFRAGALLARTLPAGGKWLQPKAHRQHRLAGERRHLPRRLPIPGENRRLEPNPTKPPGHHRWLGAQLGAGEF